jgi:hypothetical protein
MLLSQGCQDINPNVSIHVNINTEIFKSTVPGALIYQRKGTTRKAINMKDW